MTLKVTEANRLVQALKQAKLDVSQADVYRIEMVKLSQQKRDDNATSSAATTSDDVKQTRIVYYENISSSSNSN